MPILSSERLVAIDTATEVGHVALFVSGGLVLEATQRVSNAHGESLLPLLSDLLKRAHLSPSEIDTWVVDVGPGSFTGVRVGVATVTGILIGARSQSGAAVTALGIVSLDALVAHEGVRTAHPCSVRVGVIPSVRGEVFLGARGPDDAILLTPTAVLHGDVERVLSGLGRPLSEIVLVGAGADALAKRVELAACSFLVAPPHESPSAVVLAELALAGHGRQSLDPVYVKPPAIHPGALLAGR